MCVCFILFTRFVCSGLNHEWARDQDRFSSRFSAHGVTPAALWGVSWIWANHNLSDLQGRHPHNEDTANIYAHRVVVRTRKMLCENTSQNENISAVLLLKAIRMD